MQLELIEKTEKSEAEIQNQIIALLMLKKYLTVRVNSGSIFVGKRLLRCYRIANNGKSSGFPDIIALKNDRALMIEVKNSKGKLKESQEDFIRLAKIHNNTVIVAKSWQEVMNYVENLEE